MPIKILAIDDSKTMRLAIKITFAAEDAEVTSVSKGSEAVARAKQMVADVVLVDAKLAEGEPSGYEVCRALKEDGATANIPVILMVSNQVGVDDAMLREVGGDGFIAKPFDTQELIDKVGEVMGKPVARAVPSTMTRPSIATPASRPVEATVAAASSSTSGHGFGAPKPAATATATAPKPIFTPPPTSSSASRSSPSWSSASVSGRSGDAGRDGEIPVVVPIPFASAAAPTAGMLRRLQEATPGDPLDPAVVQALLSLSRDVIERVVWEVVPDLAEEIIRKQASKHLQSA